MIDFPANPVLGQAFNSGQGTIYTFDGTAWVVAPVAVKTARTRNRFVNPCAQVSQQYGTTAITVTGYPADQFAADTSGIVFSGQKVTLATATPEGTKSAVAIWATTAKASLAATDYLYMYLPIEGLDIADLGWGAAGAKPVVLRFCATCDTVGTYGFAIPSGPNDAVWCGSFTIAQAGVPQVFSFAIPGPTIGTWPVTNAIGLSLRFGYAFGSNYVGTAGWGTGNRMGVAGCTNGAAVANSKLSITDAGFYADPDNTGVPPPFVAPAYYDELTRCKRYWRLLPGMAGQVIEAGSSAIFACGDINMRTLPTSSIYSAAGKIHRPGIAFSDITGMTPSLPNYFNLTSSTAIPANIEVTLLENAILWNARM